MNASSGSDANKTGNLAGMFKDMCRTLLITVDAVSRDNHKAVQNELFHRYLKKVQGINTATTMFEVDMQHAPLLHGCTLRSVVPFRITTPPPFRVPNVEGQHALDHVDATIPLLRRQQELLNILNQQRRLRHRELRNNKITPQTF